MLSHLPPHHLPQLYIPDYPLARQKLPDPPCFVLSQSFPNSVSPIQPDSPATVEDDAHSPHSPLSGSGNYHYADNRNSGSFDSPISPADMYEPHGSSYSTAAAPQPYHPLPSAIPTYGFIASDPTVREPQFDRSYFSESPSPVDPQPSSYPQGSGLSQDRRSSQITPPYPVGGDRFDAPPELDTNRYPRNVSQTRYSGDSSPPTVPLDRRMSEPAILAPHNPYASQPSDTDTPHRTQFNYTPSAVTIPRPSAYVPSLHRGASLGSLRDLRHAHLGYPATQSVYSNWKDDAHVYHGDDGFSDPLSPLQPDFSGGGISSSGPVHYSPATEHHYGPSPPGTGTSTSSTAPLMSPTATTFHTPTDETTPTPRDSSRTYSFVALPGNAVKKRPRRRYDEIERLYRCSWPDCNKAYGTLNHLNAHVTMQKHGSKRSPNEFKELRKQWRKAKKSTSPGPIRRGNLGLRHDVRDYQDHRYEPMGSSSSLYSRQPSYHTSGGISSSAPSMLADSGDRLPYPVDINRYQVERGDNLTDYSAQARRRYSGSTPASWHESSRLHMHQSYNLSTSQPSRVFTQHGNNLPLDPHMAPQSQPQHPTARTHPSLEPPMGRLPPDSTLLTPLPGYQPPSLLPPLQGDNVSYPADSGYEMYDDGQDGRPHTGHGSVGRGSEEDY